MSPWWMLVSSRSGKRVELKRMIWFASLTEAFQSITKRSCKSRGRTHNAYLTVAPMTEFLFLLNIDHQCWNRQSKKFYRQWPRFCGAVVIDTVSGDHIFRSNKGQNFAARIPQLIKPGFSGTHWAPGIVDYTLTPCWAFLINSCKHGCQCYHCKSVEFDINSFFSA